MQYTQLHIEIRGCRHWRGSADYTTCSAGVDITKLDWRNSPCHRNDLATEPWPDCPLRSLYSVEELQAEDKAIDDMLNKFQADLDKDICPHCGGPIESKKQVGRCVYAYPCGDRLYQGRLKL